MKQHALPDHGLNHTHAAALEDFVSWLSMHRSPSTVTLREQYIRRLMAWTELNLTDNDAATTVWNLGYRDISTWLSRAVGPSPSTKYAARSSLRVFYGWGTHSGLTETNPATRLPSIRRPEGLPRPCPDAVFQRALSRGTRRRDILMLLLGYYAGLRAAEMASLHTRDIVWLTTPIHRAESGGADHQQSVGSIRVAGKGGKARMVPMHPVLADFVIYFEGGFFFPSNYSETGHVLPASIGRRIRDLLKEKGWNAHSLRHTFASEVYNHKGDILALKDLLGHSSVSTTQIYARADSSRLNDHVSSVKELEGVQAAKESLAAIP